MPRNSRKDPPAPDEERRSELGTDPGKNSRSGHGQRRGRKRRSSTEIALPMARLSERNRKSGQSRPHRPEGTTRASGKAYSEATRREGAAESTARAAGPPRRDHEARTPPKAPPRKTIPRSARRQEKGAQAGEAPDAPTSNPPVPRERDGPPAPPTVEYLTPVPEPGLPVVDPSPATPDSGASATPPAQQGDLVGRKTRPRSETRPPDGDVWIGVPKTDFVAFLDPPAPPETVRFVEGGARPFAVTICHGVAATVYRAWSPVPAPGGAGEFRDLDGRWYRRIGSQRGTPTELMLAYAAILEAFPTLREDGDQDDGCIFTTDLA